MNQNNQCPCMQNKKPEQYVSLPAQYQNKYTPYYQSYDQQSTGNIAETPNILTQYTQTTKQTTNYDLMQSYPAVNGIYLQNQMITNQRPIPIYDANGIGAAQRAQYGLQQRQFDNNIKSGVNIIQSPQIQDIQMSLKPNGVFSPTQYNNVQSANLANAPFSKMNPEQNGLVTRVDGQNYSNQPQQIDSVQYSANPTEVQSPDYNEQTQTMEPISPETGSNITVQEVADTLTTPEMYKYLEGFRRFQGLNLQNQEKYSRVVNKIKYDSQGLTQLQIFDFVQSVRNKFNIPKITFTKDYLEGVVIGKINGVDISNVWKKNSTYKIMTKKDKQRLDNGQKYILSINNLRDYINEHFKDKNVFQKVEKVVINTANTGKKIVGQASQSVSNIKKALK